MLGIFDQNIVEMWFTASSMLLAFVFMFGNSIKQLFESVIFIFVIHPFDVGDNVLIEGERHAICNIGILTTETVKWNGQVIYYPNMSMSTKPLTNLTRMKKFTDEQTWVVDIATPHVLEAMPLYFPEVGDGPRRRLPRDHPAHLLSRARSAQDQNHPLLRVHLQRLTAISRG